MKCHCQFKAHCKSLRAKRLGLLGGIIMVVHLLYHVAGCLFLPAAFMALHDHLHHDTQDIYRRPAIISQATHRSCLLSPLQPTLDELLICPSL